ncbi:MAG TPA: hypothetical protein VGK52_03765 [Polyangia bacterium]|jgi:hypothetical protein
MSREQIDWSALPEVPLPAALAERVHARARAAFERGRGEGRAADVAMFVAVTAAIAIYLGWAVEFLRAFAPT